MKAVLALVVLSLVCVYCLPSTEEELKEAFAGFVKNYQKSYDNVETYRARYEIFKQNVQTASNLNARNKGNATFGITKFMDLSSDEFRSMYLGYKPSAIDKAAHYEPRTPVAAAPSTFDWRSKKAVTPVKNQGQCGSCWAFSATEAIESAWFLSNHTLISLAPQQIVDCDTTDDGCNGGDTPTAYAYVLKAGGMETEEEYPYVGEDQNCQFKKEDVKATINSWHYITTTKNETEMLERLYEEGPVSVCVDAVTWQFYIYGVIAYGDLCENSLDHCVMVTGYGEFDSYKVWNVRNSWGTDWGYSGYLYVERGYDLCGIADEVTIPVA